MKINAHGVAIGTFTRMLANLAAILDKGRAHAEAKKIDEKVLAGGRLFPDMFPLSRQVQIACDHAKNGAARLAGVEAPKFEDTEQTLADLVGRVRRTMEYVATIAPAQLEGTEERTVKIPMRDRTIEMDGLAYIEKWALPNFYFHVTTAYNILRHNGVEIGKKDFLGPTP